MAKPVANRKTLRTCGSEADQIGDAPGQHDEQADVGNIRVAVGDGLLAHLDETDDRHQGAHVPEPAHRQVTPSGNSRPRHQTRNRQQETNDRDGRIDVVDMVHVQEVEHRHLARPEHPADIVRYDCNEFSMRKPIGNPSAGSHRAAVVLGVGRDDGGSDGKGEERDFLQHQAAGPVCRADAPRGLRRGAAASAGKPLVSLGLSPRCRRPLDRRPLRRRIGSPQRQTAQRPVVQQQANAGQRHQHRLGQQAKRIEDEDQAIEQQVVTAGRHRVDRQRRRKSGDKSTGARRGRLSG